MRFVWIHWFRIWGEWLQLRSPSAPTAARPSETWSPASDTEPQTLWPAAWSETTTTTATSKPSALCVSRESHFFNQMTLRMPWRWGPLAAKQKMMLLKTWEQVRSCATGRLSFHGVTQLQLRESPQEGAPYFHSHYCAIITSIHPFSNTAWPAFGLL